MGRRGGTSRARRGVLCVEGCSMLRYAKHVGLRGFVCIVLQWVEVFSSSGNKKNEMVHINVDKYWREGVIQQK